MLTNCTASSRVPLLPVGTGNLFENRKVSLNTVPVTFGRLNVTVAVLGEGTSCSPLRPAGFINCCFPGSAIHLLDFPQYRPLLTPAYVLHHILGKKGLMLFTFCCAPGGKSTVKCGTAFKWESFIPNLKNTDFYLICIQSNIQITFHGN